MPRLLLWGVGLVVSAGLVTAAEAHEVNPKVIERLTGEVVDTRHHEEHGEADPRDESRRFYTVPEWYIVYTAQEYGAFVGAGGRPSQFPYFRSTSQLWEVWREAERVAGEPPDPTTSTVLWTIAISTSIEQILIGSYEATVGRVSEWLHFGYKTTEDRYVDAVAVEYGDFLTQTPWYAFPYGQKLVGLWTTWGWSSLSPRGIERRLAYTLGYGVKAVYAGVIGALSQSQFEGGAGLVTDVLVRADVGVVVAAGPTWQVTPHEAGQVHVSLPRYRAFRAAFEQLATVPGEIISIQSHNRITFSVVESVAVRCKELTTYQGFALPVLSQPGLVRVIYDVPVTSLHAHLTEARACGYEPEHIYDF